MNKVLRHYFTAVDADQLLSLARTARVRWASDLQRDAALDAALDDDIIQFLYPTLAWIPSENPFNDRERDGMGLCLYGGTLIRTEHCAALADLASCWIELFRLAPAVFGWPTGHRTAAGPEPRQLQRQAVLEQLAALVDVSIRASDAGKAVLHLGV